MGDKETYPYHPLSEKFKKPVTWKFLKESQDYNLVHNLFFGTGNLIEDADFKDEANDKYKKQKLDFLRNNL